MCQLIFSADRITHSMTSYCHHHVVSPFVCPPVALCIAALRVSVEG